MSNLHTIEKLQHVYIWWFDYIIPICLNVICIFQFPQFIYYILVINTKLPCFVNQSDFTYNYKDNSLPETNGVLKTFKLKWITIMYLNLYNTYQRIKTYYKH